VKISFIPREEHPAAGVSLNPSCTRETLRAEDLAAVDRDRRTCTVRQWNSHAPNTRSLPERRIFSTGEFATHSNVVDFMGRSGQRLIQRVAFHGLHEGEQRGRARTRIIVSLPCASDWTQRLRSRASHVGRRLGWRVNVTPCGVALSPLL
jgi:hypothetical protein